ncbi:polyphosphate kinase 1 [Leeia sp. TBRC 13508]|uniref:Polyphosphate kinase n=1 Tax=Leeia speluncae TaxID=2884804 RepID=A0ABS8D4A4_9NEIS|nr:polyphosphate kinase 1 [Leeia speluncae]MCB6182833.1 polyphosphate kinase 1 [Leeia speluncae]
MTSHSRSEHLLNRELGLIEFNRRVLAQAEDVDNPLLERLKFLCIVSSNLDELFEVRVAGLKQRARLANDVAGQDGYRATELLDVLSERLHNLIAHQYKVLREEVLPALSAEGVQFLRRPTWNEAQQAWVKDYFFREVMPVLTPIGLDPSHPFPRVLNKSLNFAVELEGRDAFGRNSGIAIVQAPRALPRIIPVPSEISGVPNGFVFLSSILHAHVNELFSGMSVLGCFQFRATRDADLAVDEEDLTDLREALQDELSHRQFGEAVRLEIADNCPEHIEQFLLEQFKLSQKDIYRVDGPVNLVRMMQVPDLVDRPDLKFAPFRAGYPTILQKRPDSFEAIAKGDILLHHPFQSFSPVISFLQQAASDPQVVAIKMTVYRTGTDSVLMEALIEAAKRGKEVTVVVELMARFDEEANINWADRLEDAGAHVVYGVVGYKTHAKMLMVVRRESKGLRRYVHLGTGNYHPRTTKFYTDFGLLTANEEIGADVADVFTQLTGLGKAGKLRALWQSPFSLQPQLIKSIENEIRIAKAGRKGRIIAKMNALLEPQVIEALYQASQAGVEVDLIIRGVCALRPGVEGLSDNIRVRSIVGRFLEHTRIFYFHNDKQETLMLSSADWMHRNLFRRIEVAFPILDAKLKRRVIREGLMVYLNDNRQTWEMQKDGFYRQRPARKGHERLAQRILLSELAESTN